MKKNAFGNIYQRYFIKALSGMAQGLFGSLIIGLILTQLAQIPYMYWLAPLAAQLGATSPVVGAAIGVGVALALEAKPLAVVASAGTAALAYGLGGGPVGAYLAAVVSAEFGTLVSGKTPMDIVVVPLVAIILGGLVAQYTAPPIGKFMLWLGGIINDATNYQPFLMGVIISVLMGVILTAPISSAAIAMSLGLTGLAAGAATVGCCAHMIGFAVISYRANRVGGLLAQGLGTSMLQVPNIMRKPVILVAPVFASLVLGPLATAKFIALQNIHAGAGMGTSGLVGPLGVWTAMSQNTNDAWPLILLKILLFCFLLPALLSLAAHTVCLRMKWYRVEDMKLEK